MVFQKENQEMDTWARKGIFLNRKNPKLFCMQKKKTTTFKTRFL